MLRIPGLGNPFSPFRRLDRRWPDTPDSGQQLGIDDTTLHLSRITHETPPTQTAFPGHEGARRGEWGLESRHKLHPRWRWRIHPLILGQTKR